MEDYKVQLSKQAKEDYKNIIYYIRYKLLEPNIARKYAELIKKEINTLKYQPKKYTIIDYDVIKKYEFRKLIIKNHIVFYKVDEDKKIVNIERILCGGTNWKSRL